MSNSTVNPFTDPKDDPSNPLKYIPSNALTTIGVVAFGLVASTLTWRLNASRWSGRYMLAIVVGSYTMTAGLALRYLLARHPDSKGIYIGEDLLVVLSPCAFIAGNYSLLGKIAANVRMGKYLFIRPERLTKVFVSSDVITFLIQAGGGSMTISKNSSTVKLGSDLLKIGMILQFVSFVFYTTLFAIWTVRVRKNAPNVWRLSYSTALDGSPINSSMYSWRNDWRTLAGALALSCTMILIRSVYRTIEGTQGYNGSLATNEHLFYLCDTLPLCIAVGVYGVIWPGCFIDPSLPVTGADDSNELKVGEYAHLSRTRS